MAIPDPATTEWVPIWNPTSAGPVGPAGPTGPQGPQGDPGPAGVAGPHHVQHETGGTDAVVSLSGGVITSGTVADARLSANVPLKNVANTFTQDQRIEKATPFLTLFDTAQPANLRRFNIINTSQLLYFQSVDDGQTAESSHVQFNRAGEIFERARPVAMGVWIDVPFVASNFLASSGTWTVSAGNVTNNRYTLIGKTMIWTIRIQGSATSGALNQYMHLIIPAGFSAPNYSGFTRATEMYDGSTNPVRVYPAAGAGNLVTIEKEPSAAFTPGTLYLSFTLTFEIL